MIINYKLGKIFGPSMVFAGYILMVFGILTLYFTLSSIGLVIIGTLIAFTSSGTRVETEKRQYKRYLLLAGVLLIGKNQSFENDDVIEVKKYKGTHRTYSMSNRQSTVEINDYRLYLIKRDPRRKIWVASFDTEEEAFKEIEILRTIVPA